MSPTTRPSAEPPAEPVHDRLDPKLRKALGAPPPEADPQREEGHRTDAAMWGIVGHLAASIVVYGGVGYLIGRWTGHPILLLFGVLFGLALSLGYTVYSANKNAPK